MEIVEFNHEQAADYLQSISLERFASNLFQRRGGELLLQPRGGVGGLYNQQELMSVLSHGGADFIPITIDSNTRLGDEKVAAKLLEREEHEGIKLLNGFPLTVHGVEKTRWLCNHFEKPISLRHGTPDARRLVGFALQSGITDIEGGPISYLFPYSRSADIKTTLLNWAEVERMCSALSTQERKINRESFGPLTATMVPPTITIAVQILELMFSISCGVKSFTVSFGQLASINQNLICNAALRSAVEELGRFVNMDDIDVHYGFHQWMGAFPYSREKAISLISLSTFLAKTMKIDKMITKTYEEAFGVPSAEDNRKSLEFIIYAKERGGRFPVDLTDEMQREIEMTLSEVFRIIDPVMLPFKMAMQGKGFEEFYKSISDLLVKGHLDIPFAPHEKNGNRLLTVNDEESSIRIFRAGYMNYSQEFLDYELSKIGSRVKNNSISEILLDDIMWFNK